MSIQQLFPFQARKRAAFTEQFEPLQPHILASLIKALNIHQFLDIGANVGWYSIFLRNECESISINAFEPTPRTFALLNSTIKRNGYETEVLAHNTAISNVNQSLELGIARNSSGSNSAIETTIYSRSQFKKTISVPTTSLDKFYNGVSGKRFAIKIDVEGHEQKVVESGKTFLSSNEAIIQIENDANKNASACVTLADLGFENILTIGPDQYWTNITESTGNTFKLQIIESASARMLEFRESNRCIQRDFLGLFTIGLSPCLSNLVRKHFIF